LRAIHCAAFLQGNAALFSRFSSLVQQESARLEGAYALFDGRPVDGGAPLSDLLPADAASAHPEVFELLCPPACAAAGATGRQIFDGSSQCFGNRSGGIAAVVRPVDRPPGESATVLLHFQIRMHMCMRVI